MKLRVLPALGGSLIVGLAVAGCGPAQSSPPATAAGTTSAAAAAAATASAPAATSPSAAAPSGSPAVSAAASAGGVQNLIADASIKQQLIAAIAQYHGFSASNIASTKPGSVYYAYDPANGTYYAWASFVLVAGASLQVQQSLVGLDDVGSTNFFKKVGNGPWEADPASEVICQEGQFFPAPVLAVWDLTPTPTELAEFNNCDD